MRWNSAYASGRSSAHLADRLGRPDAGHDVLALGVGQVLAVEHLLAGVRVAGERDAGARVVAHVAEDHRHDVHGRAQVVGDLVVLAVVAGALAEPGREDGLDREVELLVRVGGKSRPVSAWTIFLNSLGDLAQRGRVEVRVLADAAARLGRSSAWSNCSASTSMHDPAEHLDEAPIGVPAEALVAGQRDQALERLLVEAEVEDRVHHPGHRELGARADAHEQRVRRVAEALAGLALDLPDRLEDVVPEAVGQLLAGARSSRCTPRW